MSYEESVKIYADFIRPQLLNLEAFGRDADKEIAEAKAAERMAWAIVEEIAKALHNEEASTKDLVEWAKKVYSLAYTPEPNSDHRVRGLACWGSLTGGKSWDERAACEQVDHFSVTQKWNKWSPTVGFSQAALAAKKSNKGLWLSIYPGLGPELPPDIQTLVPQNQRITTVVRGNTSWRCPWWIEAVRNAWMLGPIQSMADLHGEDPQLSMVHAVMPPMSFEDPYSDGNPTTPNITKWVAAWRASGKGKDLDNASTWDQLCDDYYKTLGLLIEFLAVSFPESVMIGVEAGIGMGDSKGRRLKSMLDSLLVSTRARVCLQYNELNHKESPDDWIRLTALIAEECGLVLGYQTITGAMGGGPGPMGPQMLDEALAVGNDYVMSYCEVYAADIDAILEGNVSIANILDKEKP
jgi:hypothetical protein